MQPQDPDGNSQKEAYDFASLRQLSAKIGLPPTSLRKRRRYSCKRARIAHKLYTSIELKSTFLYKVLQKSKLFIANDFSWYSIEVTDTELLKDFYVKLIQPMKDKCRILRGEARRFSRASC